MPCEISRLCLSDSSFVLERHLKQTEVIQPKREVGRFKGEPVYRRANVLQCRTAENWMRVGRRVMDRQEPMKWIKQRAVTIQKRRAQELAIQETGEAIQQGLYAENQTELYIPPAIVDVSCERDDVKLTYRARFRRTRSGTSTSTCQPCFRLVPSICLVSFLRGGELTSRQGHREGGEEAGRELRRGCCESLINFFNP